jgi:hypothetical protein
MDAVFLALMALFGLLAAGLAWGCSRLQQQGARR